MAELSNTSLASDGNLEAYYKLSSGALTTDSSGNSETLTNQGTVADGTGKYGGAADLGASNSSKYLYRASNLGITNKTLSMTCWVKLQTEISANTCVFMQHSNNTSDTFYQLKYEYNGGTRRIALKGYKVGGGDASVYSYHTVTLGTSSWHHLGMTCDGTTQRLYYNGIEKDSDTTVVNGSESHDDIIAIGANYMPDGNYGDPGPNTYASALIDDAAFFSRKLTDAEMLELYTGGKQQIIIF